MPKILRFKLLICYDLFYLFVNLIYLDCGLSVIQHNTFEDTSLASGNLTLFFNN